MSVLSILAVDDEAPSLDELSYLLARSPLVGRVTVASSATEGLRRLKAEQFDAVLLDIRMPGLDGMELARVLARFASPPAVVFVTAHEDHAVEAFEVGAAGYLLKPVDAQRLDRALQRAVARLADRPEIASASGATGANGAREGGARDEPARHGPLGPDGHDVVAVDSGARTLLLALSDIAWVESAGDYVRLHLRDGANYLLRTPMATLEEQWADRGFVRIHRGFLVSLADITEIRTDGAHTTVHVGSQELTVSRRHVHDLRDRLVRYARPGGR